MHLDQFIAVSTVEAILEGVIPILGCIMIFGIPIIAILTGHQRKMAELMRQDVNQVQPHIANEVLALRQEVANLKEMVHTQMIALDDAHRLSAPANQPVIPPEIRQT